MGYAYLGVVTSKGDTMSWINRLGAEVTLLDSHILSIIKNILLRHWYLSDKSQNSIKYENQIFRFTIKKHYYFSVRTL